MNRLTDFRAHRPGEPVPSGLLLGVNVRIDDSAKVPYLESRLDGGRRVQRAYMLGCGVRLFEKRAGQDWVEIRSATHPNRGSRDSGCGHK